MTKTMSSRMDRDNYEFLAELSKAERSDLSKPCATWLRATESCLPSRDTERERLL